MPPQPPKRLSEQAFADLKAIVAREIPEPMGDSEIEEMGIRLLHLVSLLVKPAPVPEGPRPTEEEAKLLKFIQEERKEDRNPTARSVAKYLGLRSSRSGARRLNTLMSKGWVVRDKIGRILPKTRNVPVQ